MTKLRSCQVAIVGGGLIGSTLALILTRAGIRTVLLERNKALRHDSTQPYSTRVSAISLASEYLLRNLQVWKTIADQRVSPYHKMYVCNHSGNSALHFDCVEIMQPHLGNIIENDLIQSAVMSALDKQNEFELIEPADIREISTNTKGAVIKLNNSVLVKANLLVGADGATSMVRQTAGIKASKWPYNQTALTAVIEAVKPHHTTAWQRFLKSGPLALLPLADGRSSIVWSLAAQEAQRIQKLNDASFCSELTDASMAFLGEVTACGPRTAFSLQYQHAKHYTAHRLALVGDAAHVVHPLAGQGVNLGFLDIVTLAELLISANDPGSSKLLRRYERARKSENTVMGLAFDCLHRLFATRSPSIENARDLGMNYTSNSVWLKRFLMSYATGLQQTQKAHQLAKQDFGNKSLISPP